MSDKFTTMSNVNKKGGLQSHECNKIAKNIWICCTSRDLHISAAHIPGKNNSEADKISRKFQEASEWQLNPKIYKAIRDIFGTPEVGYLPVRSTDKLFQLMHFLYIPLKIRLNLTNLILPQDKAAAHRLAEKLALHIRKFNPMGD